MILDSDFAIQQIVLKKLKLSCATRIPAHILQMSGIERTTDIMRDEFIYYLQTYITAHTWTEKHSTSTFIEVPLTWIDAVRIRFAPKFLVAKYPIKYRKIKTGDDVSSNYWIFPEVPPNPDKNITDFIMAYSKRR
jgi:hypothetical protein